MLLSDRDIGDSRVRREAAAIAAAGHEVTVLSQLKRKGSSPRYEVEDGVLYWRTRYHRIKPLFLNLPLTFGLGRWAIRFIDEIDPDIIHAHDLMTLPIAVRLARGRKARVIYDSHELNTERVGNSSRFRRWYLKDREARYIRGADAVITVSAGVAGHLQNTYAIEPPTLIMNSPAIRDIGTGNRPSAGLRGRLALEHDVPLAVYTGGRNMLRGIEKVVEALGCVPELHFALVGSTSGDTDVLLARIADAGGYGNRLHFLPSVPHDQVTQYVSSADFSIIPYCDPCLNYQYAMPNKLFEAVFSGLPVAVSDVPDLKRFVESTGTGAVMNMFDADSVVATLATMVERRSEMRPTRTRMDSLARVYGWPEQSRKLLALYDRVASTAGLPGRF